MHRKIKRRRLRVPTVLTLAAVALGGATTAHIVVISASPSYQTAQVIDVPAGGNLQQALNRCSLEEQCVSLPGRPTPAALRCRRRAAPSTS